MRMKRIGKRDTLSQRKIERYTNRNVDDCFAYGFSCSRVEFEDMDTNVADPAIITTDLPIKLNHKNKRKTE